MKYVSRRSFLAGAAAIGALPLFNIGCAGFGQGRARRIAQGAKIRVADPEIALMSWAGDPSFQRAGAADLT